MQFPFSARQYLVPTAVLVLVAQPAHAQVAQIVDVELFQVEDGIEVVLSVPGGDNLQISTSSSETEFIAEINNAQLKLSQGDLVELDNPIEGIQYLSVVQTDKNLVQISVVAEQVGYASEVEQTPQNILFRVADAAVGTEPPSTPDSTEPSPEDPQPPLDTEPLPPEGEISPDPGLAPPDAAPPPTGEDSSPPPEAEAEAEPEEQDGLELVVTARRRAEALKDIPRSVSVVTREQLEQESLFNNDLSNSLGKFVPGFGPPTATGRTRSQTLRGRTAQILIDGIPQNTNTSFDSELSVIDPSAIERVEVVRGPTAVFGGGATGGSINIITRAPAEEGITGYAGTTLRPDFENLSQGGFSFNVQGGLTAKKGKFDLLLNSAFDLDLGSFDAEGDRIPPNQLTSDNRTINVLAKLGYDISENQRLQFSYNIFDNDFSSDFISDPIILTRPGNQEAEALRFPIDFDERPRQNVQNFNLTYRHQDVLGSEFNAQIFYRIIDLTQVPSDVRTLFPSPFFLPDAPRVFQTNLEAEQVGTRIQINTPIDDKFSILWGSDLIYEENVAPFNSLDPDAFDANQGTIIATPTQSPFYSLRTLGVFAQFKWDVIKRVSLSGGARYENIRLDVPDYSADPFSLFDPFSPTRQIQGAEITVDDVVFNAGIVFQATDEISLFANFAQGFSLPQLGTTLGQALFGDSLAGSIALEPQRVNNYELGIRGQFDDVTFTVAGFLSESELGAVLVPDETGFASVVRAPQRNFGVEATVDWQLSDRWQLGAIFTWNEGDIVEDGEFVALPSIEVQPMRATVYVENETLPGWRNRLQSLIVGGRDRAFDDGVDTFEVEGYATVDFFSSLEIGPGKLQFGIQNLLDTEFLPVSSQERVFFTEPERFSAEGRTFSIRYTFKFK